MGFSETRLSSGIEALYQVPGFEKFTSNRNTMGGGVVLYTKDTLNANFVHSISVIHDHIETVFVCFSIGNVKFLIGNIYRRPRSNVDDFLRELTNILDTIRTCYIDTRVYLMGDFNLSLFDINNNNKCMEYFMLMSSFGFSPTIVRPTRVSCSSKTLIDNIWTNNINAIKTSGVILSTITDHFPVFVSVNLNVVVPVYQSTYMVRKKNRACYEYFENRISNTDWDEISDVVGVEAMYNAFYEQLVRIYNEAFPLIMRQTKPIDLQKPYIDAQLRERIREKRKLEKNISVVL